MPEQVDDVAHTLLSRKYRKSVGIGASREIPQDMIHEMLQESQESCTPIILNVNISMEGAKYVHDIEFITVPNVVLKTIKQNGYNSAIFYVGTSEDTSKIEVLSGPPTMDMVQPTGYDGLPREFMSNMIDV